MNRDILNAENEFQNQQYNSGLTSKNLRVATFCVITKVDTTKKTLNAKPLIRELYQTSSESENYISLPELVDVPYCTALVGTPKVDDLCVCIHLDRSIKGYDKKSLMNNQGKTKNNNNHELSDCIAIYGFNL